MKKNLFKLSFIIISIGFFLMAGQAKADTATTTIRLQVKTHDAVLYDADIAVTACVDSQSASTTSVNAKCAVEQSGLASDWSWWGDDVFLNSIGSYINNDAGNGVYWAWFSNLDYGSAALNKHTLSDGEKILLTYNINPLKISTDNAAPYVNATSTITLEQFGLDASWNPVWSLAASSTLVIGGLDAENTSGVYEYIATATVPVLIYGKKTGYIDSDGVTITAQEVPVNDDGNDDNQPSNNNSVILPAASGGGGGGSAMAAPLLKPKIDLGKAIDFLIAKQAADGSFGSALQTDWSTIALASANPNGSAGQKARNYLLTDPDAVAGMNLVSDYARRAIALMSLNISPYDGVKTNYIKKITDLYDGRQFGDASLYNDDIFALLVLNKAGYGADDEMIKKTVEFMITKQQADGSFGGADLTAAAIQALEPLPSLDGVAAALLKARNFLFNAQGIDGGYGNTYATAWVMQAIAALGENAGSWLKNNNTPESYLALSQGVDGGLEKDNAYEANRIWSTAYAIPAAQNKPWFNIMQSFSKQEKTAVFDSFGRADISDSNIATSTLEISDIATSTLEILLTASSTEDMLQVKAEEKVEPEVEKAADVFSEPIKPLEPKVLAEKIILLEPKNAGSKKIAKKQNQEIARPENVSAVNNVVQAPSASPSAPKENILALAGHLIYRGFRYILNLLDF
ncbi:MAG: terpene cyclase/mutase family protein [Patescibacteria group bacterium]|nr:terpene cyclase/mutase family protein [Patescibacteria group bacterium]